MQVFTFFCKFGAVVSESTGPQDWDAACMRQRRTVALSIEVAMAGHCFFHGPSGKRNILKFLKVVGKIKGKKNEKDEDEDDAM